MKDEDFLRQAIQLAEASVRNGGGPFGAVIVRDGEIVGRGHNRVTLDNDPTAHAEVQAIRDACQHLGTFSLEGCTLYVSCEPCPMCLAACYWAHMDEVIYAADAIDAASAGFDDHFIRNELGQEKKDRQLTMRQALHDEALEVFKLWQSLEDKIEY
jgi:guanine deaminase